MAHFNILDKVRPKEATEEENDFDSLRHHLIEMWDEHSPYKTLCALPYYEENKKGWMNCLGNTTSKTMGVTFTFKQYYRDTMNEDELKDLLKRFIKSQFKLGLIKNMFKIYLVGEYDKNANYHFHGTIEGFKWKKDINQFKVNYTKQIGFMKFEFNIENIYNWIVYMYKSAFEEGYEPLRIIDKKSYIDFF